MILLLKWVCRCLAVLPPGLRDPLLHLAARVVLSRRPALRRALESNIAPFVSAGRAPPLPPRMLAGFYAMCVDFLGRTDSAGALVTMTGADDLKKLHFKHGRALVMTAHIGFWEAGLSYFAMHGLPVSGLVALYPDARRRAWLASRRDPRVEWIPYERGAGARCLERLRAGRLLGLVGDLPLGEKGEPVRIAGRTARLPLGPWILAVRTRAPVMVGAARRVGPSRYHADLEALWTPEPAVPDPAPRELLERYAAWLERTLRAWPDQWSLLSPFWENSVP